MAGVGVGSAMDGIPLYCNAGVVELGLPTVLVCVCFMWYGERCGVLRDFADLSFRFVILVREDCFELVMMSVHLCLVCV